MRLRQAVAMACVLAFSGVARAQEESARPVLAHDLRIDAPVVVATGAWWILTETVFKKRLAPASCEWCDREPGGAEKLNLLDLSARDMSSWNGNRHTADVLSNVTAFGVLPLVALGGNAFAALRSGDSKQLPWDALVVVEAVTVAAALNQTTKFIAGRERPFVHRLTESEKSAVENATDNNLSFYSGHTSFTFSMAVAAGTVASMHGYREAPAIWAAGLTTAAATGLLRMGAEKHYLTDVATGAVVGSAIGFLVPFLFHRPEGTAGPFSSRSSSPLSPGGLQLQASASALPGGAMGGFSGRF